MDKPAPETLKALKELQEADLKILEVEKKKATPPGEMVELRRKMDGLQKDVSSLEEELKGLVRGRRDKEASLEDLLLGMEKLRAQKNMVSTNEAYTALLKEMDKADESKRAIEEEILIYMERAEEISRMIEERKTELGGCSERMKILEEDNRARVAKLDDELSGMFEGRRNAESRVDGELLALYERVRKAKGGLALIGVSGGICGGCFMELRLQVISELMKGELVTCESCSRLLYREEQKVECGPG